MNDELHVECAIASCVGKGDDSAPAAFRVAQDSRLVVVADAIGHRARATAAAHRATNALIEAMPQMKNNDLDVRSEIRRAFEAANAAVYVEDSPAGLVAAPDAVSMAVLVVCGSDIVIASIGNVRCYRARAGSVSLMTRDHSAMAALRPEATAAGGQVTVDAFEIQHQNVLTRALGMTPTIQPDVTLRSARGGDRYLLCSGGLWMQLPEAQLGRAVAQARNAEDACQALRSLVRGYDFGYVLAALDLAGGSAASRA